MSNHSILVYRLANWKHTRKNWEIHPDSALTRLNLTNTRHILGPASAQTWERLLFDGFRLFAPYAQNRSSIGCLVAEICPYLSKDEHCLLSMLQKLPRSVVWGLISCLDLLMSPLILFWSFFTIIHHSSRDAICPEILQTAVRVHKKSERCPKVLIISSGLPKIHIL